MLTIIRSLARQLIKRTNATVAVLEQKINNTDEQVNGLRQEIAALNGMYTTMRNELAALAAKSTGSLVLGYFVTIRLPAPMLDMNGLSLFGQIENNPYGYTLTFQGNNGLSVDQSACFNLTDIDNIPYIELVVRNEGLLAINIQQTIQVNGNSTVMYTQCCTVDITRTCTEYSVTNIHCYPVQQLLEFARMNQPNINMND